MTVAPPITAPDASVTSPVIVPVMVCAAIGRLKQSNSKETTGRPQTDRMSCPLGESGRDCRCWLGNKFSADCEKVNTIREQWNDQRSTAKGKGESSIASH